MHTNNGARTSQRLNVTKKKKKKKFEQLQRSFRAGTFFKNKNSTTIFTQTLGFEAPDSLCAACPR